MSKIIRKINKYCHTAKEVADFLGMCNTMEEYRNWWNYITALRGPDVIDDDMCDVNVLKALLTCVIRGKEYMDVHDASVAWGIPHTLDYYNILENVDVIDDSELNSLIDALSDIKFEHYKHHLALGFQALVFYYKHGCDEGSQKDNEVYANCALVLTNISFQLERNCPFSVFKHIYEFLMLISDEVDGKVVISNGDE